MTEIVIYFLDFLISTDVPVTQLHAISIILGAIIFGVVGIIVVSVSSTLLFYLANFVDKGRDLQVAVIPAVLLTLFIFLMVGVSALLIIRLLTSQEQSKRALADKLQQLQASAARIELLTAERERNRLARELHDGVAKTLFGIEYAAGALEKMLPHDTIQAHPARQQAHFIQEICRHEGQAVREIILNLRQGYDEPLYKLMQDYLKRWQLAYGQPVHFSASGPEADFSPSVAYEIMAILEEALENVHRHSQAQTVWVAAQTSDKHYLELEIRDNGIGLSAELRDSLQARGYPGKLNGVEPLIDPAGRYHFGLTGMIERTSWLNGEFEMTSALEGGLKLKICIPLANQGE